METESSLEGTRALEGEVGMRTDYHGVMKSFAGRESWWLHSIVTVLGCALQKGSLQVK